MQVNPTHILQQGPMIGTVLRSAAQVLLGKKVKGPVDPSKNRLPLRKTIPPRSPALVRDYIQHVGGDPSRYVGVVPAHLFAQWGFPLMSHTLDEDPYVLGRVLNVGNRIEILKPLPAHEPLLLEACLDEVDDNGQRAILTERLTTGTPSTPEALRCFAYALVPLSKKKKKGGLKKERPSVPKDAKELATWRLSKRSGLHYSVLTGDFNPVHWLYPYAKAMGYRNVILHGLSQLARLIEDLNRALHGGDPGWLSAIEVKFLRPLVLPATVKSFIHEDGSLLVGEAPGAPAYLTGTYEERA